MAKILGISGSPVKNSNTDTLIKTIMDAAEFKQDFIKLSNIEVAPFVELVKVALIPINVL